MSVQRTYKIGGLYDMATRFNQMYGLPIPHSPLINHTTDMRLVRFRQIIQDEISEVEDILNETNAEEKLVKLADWLGDIIVYCATEARRHGIEIDGVLEMIDVSNQSKLGDDGKPIIENGKVMKGPNFRPPEEDIRAYLQHIQYSTLVREE
jgi:predicted HAD superfamily Cof-like phosphohydrolase